MFATFSPAASQGLGPVLYLLGKDSSYQRGCFAPCMCPVMEQGTVRGSFVLRPTGTDPLFNHYDVTGVNWRVKTASSELRVMGSGTYRIGGQFAVQHQLVLDLSIDGAVPQHFDSGLVAHGGEFPVMNIPVSLNGMYCFDSAFFVRAHPALDVRASAQDLSWTPDPPVMSYDLVMGDLSTLGRTGGDFSAATIACMMHGDPAAAFALAWDPPVGSGFWYLVRPASPAGPGSYDGAEASQVVSRDASIAASGSDCP
jgi:hypothetical protein